MLRFCCCYLQQYSYNGEKRRREREQPVDRKNQRRIAREFWLYLLKLNWLEFFISSLRIRFFYTDIYFIFFCHSFACMHSSSVRKLNATQKILSISTHFVEFLSSVNELIGIRSAQVIQKYIVGLLNRIMRV